MDDLDLVIVAGCGHVGHPFALAFAEVGCRLGIYDTDAATAATVQVSMRSPDVGKARRRLGFEATTGLRDKLSEVIPWIRS